MKYASNDTSGVHIEEVTPSSNSVTAVVGLLSTMLCRMWNRKFTKWRCNIGTVDNVLKWCEGVPTGFGMVSSMNSGPVCFRCKQVLFVGLQVSCDGSSSISLHGTIPNWQLATENDRKLLLRHPEIVASSVSLLLCRIQKLSGSQSLQLLKRCIEMVVLEHCLEFILNWQ